MKYIKIGWPEIQEYMEYPDFNEKVFFDAKNNVWFIPEDWDETVLDYVDESMRKLAWDIHLLICSTHDFGIIDKYVTDICDY